MPDMRCLLLALCLLCAAGANAADKTPSARQHLKKDAAWFRSEEALRIADNLVTWQADNGAWQEEKDLISAPYSGDRKKLKGTFDDHATVAEARFLAKVIAAGSARPAHRESFDRALRCILSAQYANGGWPHYPPPVKSYHRHITFNDNTMSRLMWLLREIATEKTYAFVPEETRQACAKAFDKGVECILRCQIVVEGKRTVWCAQHDENDFSPRPARTFELVSFSGMESIDLIRILMAVENPSDEVKAAIEGAVAWFEAHRIKGIRVEEKSGLFSKDRVVVQDPKAQDLWARFYDLKTGKPFFCSRDGVPRENLSEISHERRNGYSWYGEYARDLLTKDYPAWKQRLGR
jgi:PelA/Pel-15E family pectate lyase